MPLSHPMCLNIPKLSPGTTDMGVPGIPRTSGNEWSSAGWRMPPAEAGHVANGAFSLAETGCDLESTLDSWKNNLQASHTHLP